MATIAVLAVIFGGLYCAALAILGGISYYNTCDWHFLAGAILYGIAFILCLYWVFSNTW